MYLWCYFTENQSEKQVCDSNVIFLAQTSPPAVIWWEGDRWVVWSMTLRRLKEKLRHRPSWMGLDFLTVLLAPILISLVSDGSLYRARCQIPQLSDLKLISQWDRCESFLLQGANTTFTTRARLDIKSELLTSAQRLFIVSKQKQQFSHF